MRGITIIFKKTMKMSDLIDVDYRLLLLLNHLNISLGFGEKSVETICKEHNFDADCFIFLANYFNNKAIMDVDKEFAKLPLQPFLHYLKCTHSYFLDHRLPNIRRKLKAVFEDSGAHLQKVVLDFFDKYHSEVKEHMNYEDDVVFPYVKALVGKTHEDGYCIEDFEERHNDIEGKMNDLKQILMKYVDGSKNQSLMVNILMELYMSEEELEAHSYIEDQLVIPRVKAIEDGE